MNRIIKFFRRESPAIVSPLSAIKEEENEMSLAAAIKDMGAGPTICKLQIVANSSSCTHRVLLSEDSSSGSDFIATQEGHHDISDAPVTNVLKELEDTGSTVDSGILADQSPPEKSSVEGDSQAASTERNGIVEANEVTDRKLNADERTSGLAVVAKSADTSVRVKGGGTTDRLIQTDYRMFCRTYFDRYCLDFNGLCRDVRCKVLTLLGREDILLNKPFEITKTKRTPNNRRHRWRRNRNTGTHEIQMHTTRVFYRYSGYRY